MARLYAATGDGIVRLDEAGGPWISELSLAGSGAQCLAVDQRDPDTLYAGSSAQGVWRTQNGGRSWVDCALPEPSVLLAAVSPADGSIYAGTEPSRLFRSDDRGESWRELEGLLEAGPPDHLVLGAHCRVRRPSISLAPLEIHWGPRRRNPRVIEASP